MVTNKQLFAQALCDALSKQYDKDLESCAETDKCSVSHYKKMSKILGFNVVPQGAPKALSLKTRILAAALVAALLLAGCTAIIFKNEIACLFEKIYDTFIAATYDNYNDSEGSYITEYYTLSYVPEGYVLYQENANAIQASYKYKNASGKNFSFEQNLFNGTEYRFDNETGYTKVFETNGIEVYYRMSGEYHYYVWNDGNYTLRISSSESLSNEELKKIVEGIAPQK